jgi:hypothetical protein
MCQKTFMVFLKRSELENRRRSLLLHKAGMPLRYSV